MSGFEIVGVIFGVMPLIISGLEHYNDGLVPLKDMIKYEYVVKEHIRALNDDELAALLNLTSLDSDAWKRPDLDKRLQERLDQSYEGYMATVAHLAHTIFVFAKKMGLDSKFRPTWTERPNKKSFRDAISGHELKRKSAKLWKRVKLGLDRNGFDVLIREMAHENQQLEVLTQGNLDLEPIRKSRAKDMDTKYWKAVRNFAERLYSCLMTHWPCQCRTSHKASLRLDVRPNSRDWNGIDVEFGVIFMFDDKAGNGNSTPWQWKNTEIKCFEVVEDQNLSPARPSTGRNVSFAAPLSPPLSRTPSPNLQPTITKIRDLCSELARQDANSCCLGYLGDKHCQHQIYTPAREHPGSSLQAAVSLHQILGSKQTQSTLPVAIKPKDRYEIALLLASSILQLYNTSWLNENWARNDVYLLKSCPNNALSKNFYVSKSFCDAGTQALPSPDPDLALLRNPSVFNLGLALLELTFGHPIEFYESEKDLRDGKRTIMTNRLIAERLIGQIEDYEGKRYSDVVYRCIYCDFGSRITSFENDEFRQSFYKGVVVPLEEILNDFVK